MKIAKYKFSDESEKREYVHECDGVFEAQLDSAVEKISEIESLRVITLSGPTCSGKTTTAAKLVSELTAKGKKVHVISIDDFYYNRDFLVERAKKEGTSLDFESVRTIDLHALSEVIEEIFDKDFVILPKYDFESGTRKSEQRLEIDDSDIFIFEGIQALYPEVTALLSHHNFVSVYVSVAESLSVGSAVFDANEVRFFRRLVRDYNFRGSSPEFTFEIWKSVRENEDKNIYPYCTGCDVRLNSLLGYDISMLKPYLIPLLDSIESGSEYYGIAQDMIKKMAHIEEINSDYMPDISVFHEFLG
ncbi:MAG: hypothetical protein IKA74_06860 [Clostridia bacterium]|nr:hypothetical protein [Clostridia bacterium]